MLAELRANICKRSHLAVLDQSGKLSGGSVIEAHRSEWLAHIAERARAERERYRAAVEALAEARRSWLMLTAAEAWVQRFPAQSTLSAGRGVVVKIFVKILHQFCRVVPFRFQENEPLIRAIRNSAVANTYAETDVFMDINEILKHFRSASTESKHALSWIKVS